MSNLHVAPERARWASTPAKVLGQRTWWTLDCKRYPCVKCGTLFRATNPKSIAQLPADIKVIYGVMAGNKIAVDAGLARLISDLFGEGQPAAAIARMINHWHHEAFYEGMIK